MRAIGSGGEGGDERGGGAAGSSHAATAPLLERAAARHGAAYFASAEDEAMAEPQGELLWRGALVLRGAARSLGSVSAYGAGCETAVAARWGLRTGTSLEVVDVARLADVPLGARASAEARWELRADERALGARSLLGALGVQRQPCALVCAMSAPARPAELFVLRHDGDASRPRTVLEPLDHGSDLHWGATGRLVAAQRALALGTPVRSCVLAGVRRCDATDVRDGWGDLTRRIAAAAGRRDGGSGGFGESAREEDAHAWEFDAAPRAAGGGGEESPTPPSSPARAPGARAAAMLERDLACPPEVAERSGALRTDQRRAGDATAAN